MFIYYQSILCILSILISLLNFEPQTLIKTQIEENIFNKNLPNSNLLINKNQNNLAVLTNSYITESEEFKNILKIKNVSQKEKFTSNSTSDLEITIKTPSGKNSIFTDALTTAFNQNQRNRLNPGTVIGSGPIFKTIDSRSGKKLRSSILLKAHVECLHQVYRLPRQITSQDKAVDLGNYKYMFSKAAYSVSKYDVFKEENLPRDINKRRLKNARGRLYDKYKTKSIQKLRKLLLFENPCIIKAQNCRFRDYPKPVIIYYNQFEDIFGVVDEETNTLLELEVATEINYAEIFVYKSIFNRRTERLIEECPDPYQNDVSGKCPINSEPYQNLPNEEEIQQNYENFDQNRKIGLPKNYDPVKGWWLERQRQIFDVACTDSFRYDKLSIEKDKTNPINQNDIVVYIINLLRIKPVDRPIFIKNFTAKAAEKKLNINKIHFMNTSDTSI